MKTRKCPGCGKAIPFDAITCKHCGMLQFSSGNDINDDIYSEPEAPRPQQDTPMGMYGQGSQDYDPQMGQGGYAPYDSYDNGYDDGYNNYDGGYGNYDNGYADDYADGYANNYAEGYAEDYGYQNYNTEAAEDYAEVHRQIRREQGYTYEEDLQGGYDDFDPDEAEAMRRRLLVIVLAVISVLLILLIIVLIIFKSRTSEFEKKQEANQESKTYTNMIPSMADTSSELVEIPVDDSSEEDEEDEDSSEDDSSSKETKKPPETRLPTSTTTTAATTTTATTTVTTTTTTTTTTETTTTPTETSPTVTEPPATSESVTDTSESVPDSVPDDWPVLNDSTIEDNSSYEDDGPILE